jgi:hypothetical protein
MSVAQSNDAGTGVNSNSVKMKYERPALEKYGNVAEITRHSGKTNSDNRGGGKS